MLKSGIKWSLLLGCFAVLYACQKDTETVQFPALMEIPTGFPEIEHPADNAFTLERWELGKKLFFDPIMSSDKSISCASCHDPALAFSDKLAFSLGVENREGTRNASPLTNLAWHPYFTREGGIPSLEMQVLVPLQEHNEFDYNIVLLSERLKNEPDYVAMALAAYDREPDHFVITRALACFERSLISGQSPYDQFNSQSDKDALTDAQQRGMQLFFGQRTNCSSCHAGFNFTNYEFENNGLYEQYTDPGRFRLTGDVSDIARFKVPGLRNIGLTGPYMHDGSISSLEEVVEHYNSGGKFHPHKNKLVKPLGLTQVEKEDLVHFLEALTDETFVSNPLFTTKN
jgi:cytochrome c peroxidase